MVTFHGKLTTFRFLRPAASQVYLVGDFNGWHHHQLPMSRTADGCWTAALRLAPGMYQFRYLADGEWFVDYASFGVEHGPFGLNGVAHVPESPTPATSDRRPVACDTCPHLAA